LKLSETKNQTRFKLLQVSESGHGKTTRALTATAFGQILVIDLDEKLAAMKGRISPEIQEKVDIETPKSIQELEKLVDSLTKAYRDGQKPYSTIVLDTWSRCHDLTIEAHRALNPKQVNLELRDWGMIKRMNKSFLERLLSLPCNIIVNTHVGKEKDSTDRILLTVGTTGSFGQEMPALFNETHYLFFEDNKFKVRGSRSNNIVSNTALPEKYLDEKGLFRQNDLSVFGEIAFKINS